MSHQLYQNGQEAVVATKTTDYQMFNFDPRNRPVDPDRVCELYDAISEKNLLHDYPIVVDGNMTILDGQHRVKAAEGLGVPVYYIVSQDATIEDIANVSHTVKRWNGMDYLHHWCAQGRPDYLRLKTYLQQYPFITLNLAMKLCHYGDYSSLYRTFVRGGYRCNDYDFGVKVANALLDFKAAGFKGYSHTSFVIAVANLMANVDYNHQIMVGKLDYLSTKLVKCPDTDSYFALLNEIYNYRARENRVELKRLSTASPKYRVDRRRKAA